MQQLSINRFSDLFDYNSFKKDYNEALKSNPDMKSNFFKIVLECLPKEKLDKMFMAFDGQLKNENLFKEISKIREKISLENKEKLTNFLLFIIFSGKINYLNLIDDFYIYGQSPSNYKELSKEKTSTFSIIQTGIRRRRISKRKLKSKFKSKLKENTITTDADADAEYQDKVEYPEMEENDNISLIRDLSEEMNHNLAMNMTHFSNSYISPCDQSYQSNNFYSNCNNLVAYPAVPTMNFQTPYAYPSYRANFMFNHLHNFPEVYRNPNINIQFPEFYNTLQPFRNNFPGGQVATPHKECELAYAQIENQNKYYTRQKCQFLGIKKKRIENDFSLSSQEEEYETEDVSVEVNNLPNDAYDCEVINDDNRIVEETETKLLKTPQFKTLDQIIEENSLSLIDSQIERESSNYSVGEDIINTLIEIFSSQINSESLDKLKSLLDLNEGKLQKMKEFFIDNISLKGQKEVYILLFKKEGEKYGIFLKLDGSNKKYSLIKKKIRNARQKKFL